MRARHARRVQDFRVRSLAPPAFGRPVLTMIAELGSAQEAAISRTAAIGRGDGRSHTLQASARCRQPYRSALWKAKRDQVIPGLRGGRRHEPAGGWRMNDAARAA